MIKMKKYLVITIALCVGLTTFAQDKKWTLRECVDYALTNNITVKQGENTLLSNDQDVIATKGNFLPSLSADVGQSVNLGTGRDQTSGALANQTLRNTTLGFGC